MNGTASEVLAGGHGICYGKSHLLAALLRAVDIPAGITYQRLTLFDEPEDGHAIHALNTVYLQELGRWIRVDARGNKPGINARFSLDGEQLAFPIRATHGERDYKINHAVPHPAIVRTLQMNNDCLEMYRNGLPTDLEYPI
jgi:transglutaminase-like putative cysteine protease